MTPMRLVAITATSAMGTGLAATRAALRAARGGLRPCDLPDMPDGIWIGRVPGVEEVSLPEPLSAFACRNNRLAELALQQDGFDAAVADAVERHGAARIAVVLGTSTSGIEETERAYRRRDAAGALPDDYDFERTHDLHALPRYVRARLGLRGPAVSISTACTSGARAFMDAAMMIEAGLADAAIAGGVDTLCRLTLHGFNALELLSRGPSRPCAADRDGISIGEAAGLALIERATGADAGRVALLGAGASADGHHMSSPHPDGLGAVAAMRNALASAGIGPDAIDYINMHGTGTRANDAMEDRAVATLFADRVPASSTKGYTGHALGASGAVEAALSVLCIEDGIIPGCLNVAAPDPEFRSRVVTANAAAPVARVLSNSFGFGGSNCALVFGWLP